jgi:hypothetical protein
MRPSVTRHGQNARALRVPISSGAKLTVIQPCTRQGRKVPSGCLEGFRDRARPHARLPCEPRSEILACLHLHCPALALPWGSCRSVPGRPPNGPARTMRRQDASRIAEKT